jgi:hypothetical protein
METRLKYLTSSVERRWPSIQNMKHFAKKAWLSYEWKAIHCMESVARKIILTIFMRQHKDTEGKYFEEFFSLHKGLIIMGKRK